MEYDDNPIKFVATIAWMSFSAIVITVAIIWGINSGMAVYSVWSERKAGQAELARAESNRQIKTLEAKAVMESAKHLADAEIIRAEGVAKANRIIGESLKGNESYLRYLWINGLQHTQDKIIYVPTEANLPILEAGRLNGGK